MLSDIKFIDFSHTDFNDTDKEKLKYSEKTLSQCHFVHCKSIIDSPGMEPGHQPWEGGD